MNVTVKCSRCNDKPIKGQKLCKYHRDYARLINDAQPSALKKLWAKNGRERLRNQIFEHYGDKCACCKESEKRFLTIDHVNGDGAAHRKTQPNKGSGSGLWRWLRSNDFPSGFRILCANCNLAMGIYGLCPHGNLQPQITNHPANPYNKRQRTS